MIRTDRQSDLHCLYEHIKLESYLLKMSFSSTKFSFKMGWEKAKQKTFSDLNLLTINVSVLVRTRKDDGDLAINLRELKICRKVAWGVFIKNLVITEEEYLKDRLRKEVDAIIDMAEETIYSAEDALEIPVERSLLENQLLEEDSEAILLDMTDEIESKVNTKEEEEETDFKYHKEALLETGLLEINEDKGVNRENDRSSAPESLHPDIDESNDASNPEDEMKLQSKGTS